jgi:adenylate cyclase
VRVHQHDRVRSASQVAAGSAALPAAREPGPEIAQRVVRSTTIGLLAANAAGAVVTFVLATFVVPSPREGISSGNARLNAIAFAAVLLVALAGGRQFSARIARPGTQWLREDRAPTEAEREANLSFPLRQTVIEGGMWTLAALVFVAINLSASSTLAFEVGLEIVLGGLVTCSLTYLIAERLSRPATARALETAAPERPTGPALGCRLILTWASSTAVPLVAVGLIGVVALGDAHASRERLGVAVAVLAAIGVLVGLATMTMSARALAEPLRGLRSALGRVEAGDLDVAVAVDDAGEVGVLQAGFNRMAHGLRERERLRDLFGRHVGEEVARHALESEDVELGGESRDAAVLFVDVIGSTRLAATEDPTEVVAQLNAFFAIVVDCVSLHGGWVNKFEGDAALCVFGAPTPHPDAAGSALATARALRFRIENELEGLEAAIGVSAGEVVAGNIGAAERFEYTVIGDPVNEAARLTELAKTTEAKLLASDAALSRAGARERQRWQFDREESLRGRIRPTGIVAPR